MDECHCKHCESPEADPLDIARARIEELGLEVTKLRVLLEAEQAKVDWLMEEYCPDEMTPEQWARMEANAAPAGDDEQAALDKALKGDSDD